jgi:hypothetical protein
MLFDFDALWQHQSVANAVPPDPFAVAVPAGGWVGPSAAPFGTDGPAFVTNLSVGTAWAVDTGLWIRRALVVDGLAAVSLRGRIENACYVYLDGDLVGTVNPANGDVPGAPSFEVVIPASLLTEGTHELALLCLDEAGGADGTTWVWLEADYLPAVMAVWPAPGMTESIAWLNDVTIYEDGSEDRERLRNAPRHQYRMTCFVPASAQATVRNMLYGARAQRWLVPVWSQVQHVGAVLAGELTADALTSYSEYHSDSLLILWETPLRWQIIGVDQVVDANTISLTGPTEAFDDAWIAPVHKAFFDGDPARAFDGRTSRAMFNFNVEDNRALTVAAPAQYLGNDIYFEEGLLSGDTTSESIVTVFQLMDEQLGLVDYGTPWLHNRPSRSHRMAGEDAAEAWAIREFLHRRAGRLTPFWHPSFEVDLRVLNTGAVTTSLTVAADEYLRFAAARDHVAVETTAGWVARAITDAVVSGVDQVQLTLNASLAVDASAIKRVCFLGLRRLNSDRVEISFIGGTVCACALPVLDITP